MGEGEREKSAKGKREGSLTLSPQFPSLFPYPLPLSTPATRAMYHVTKFSLYLSFTHVYCYLLLQRNYKSELSLIVRVNVVLNRTVVADSD